MAVGIGSEAIDRDSSISGTSFTIIDKNNPASISGEITSIDIWANTDVTGLEVGAFYTTNGNTLKCRASEVIPGTITAGSKVNKVVSIVVEIGDYIGSYHTGGNYEVDTFGDGFWYVEAREIDPNDESAYTLMANRTISLGGYIALGISVKVATGTDDCFRRLSDDYWDIDTTHQYVGGAATTEEHGGGMRFTNITIPKGATITKAYLTLRCSESYAGANCFGKISAEDVDDAITFANDKAAFDTRFANHTTAIMDWDNIEAWTKDTDYNSPTTDGTTTFASIIQEIVDRDGWASGQDIVIFLEDFDDRSTHGVGETRLAYSYEGSSTYCPQLVITYIVNVEITVPLATVTGEGLVPTMIRDVKPAIPLATIDGAGLVPTMALDRIFSIPLATIDSEGLAPSFALGMVLSIPLATITSVGLVPTLLLGFFRGLSAGWTGSFTYTFPVKFSLNIRNIATATARALATFTGRDLK